MPESPVLDVLGIQLREVNERVRMTNVQMEQLQLNLEHRVQRREHCAGGGARVAAAAASASTTDVPRTTAVNVPPQQ